MLERIRENEMAVRGMLGQCVSMLQGIMFMLTILHPMTFPTVGRNEALFDAVGAVLQDVFEMAEKAELDLGNDDSEVDDSEVDDSEVDEDADVDDS